MRNLSYDDFASLLLQDDARGGSVSVNRRLLERELARQLRNFTDTNAAYKNLPNVAERGAKLIGAVEELTDVPVKLDGSRFSENEGIIDLTKGVAIFAEEYGIRAAFLIAAWYFLHHQTSKKWAKVIDAEMFGEPYSDVRKRYRNFSQVKAVYGNGPPLPDGNAHSWKERFEEIVQELQEARKLRRALIENLAFRFRTDQPDAPEDKLVAFLHGKADEYWVLKARLDRLLGIVQQVGGSERLEELTGSANAKIEVGEFQEAEKLLLEAETTSDLGLAEAERQEKQAEDELQRAQKAAQTKREFRAHLTLSLGETALLDGRPQAAFDHFTRGIKIVARGDDVRAADLRKDCYVALYFNGQKDKHEAMLLAVDLASQDFEYWKGRDDRKTGATLNNLGLFQMQYAYQAKPPDAAGHLSRAISYLDDASAYISRTEDSVLFANNRLSFVNAQIAAHTEQIPINNAQPMDDVLEICNGDVLPPFEDGSDPLSLGTVLTVRARLHQAIGNCKLGDAARNKYQEGDADLTRAIGLLAGKAHQMRRGEALENQGNLFKDWALTYPSGSEDRRALIDRSRASFTAALEIYTDEKAPYYIEKCRKSLDGLDDLH